MLFNKELRLFCQRAKHPLSLSVFMLSVIFHFKQQISGLRTKLPYIYSAAGKKTLLVSDRNRTKALNVKSSSQEPVSHFLKTLIIVELSSVVPLSFLLAALQISLLFLWMASLLHAALLCLSFTPPRPSYLSSSVLPLFISELLLFSRLALSVCVSAGLYTGVCF